MTVYPDPKKKTYRNADYLDYVRTLPCLFCQRPPLNEAHHISLSDAGFGMKSSDLGVISLCREHHQLWHDDTPKFKETIDGYELTDAMYWQMRGFLEQGGSL